MCTAWGSLRRSHVLTLVSWAIAAAILGLLVWRADRAALADALATAELGRYLIVALGFVALWLALDSFVLSWLFGRLGARVSWGAMARIRGATYLPMALSFHLASAALVGVVHERTGTPLARAAAVMLVLYAGDLAALTGVAFLASLGASSPWLSVSRPLLAATCAGTLTIFAAGRLMRRRLSGRPFFGVLADLAGRDVALLVALRALFQASFVGFVWLTLPAFAIDLSLRDVAARVPIVLSVGALPITPGGLGTTQAAMVALFGELADTARVLAYAVLFGASLVFLRLPIGAALAPGVLRRARPAGGAA